MRTANSVYKIGAAVFLIILLSYIFSAVYAEHTRRILSVMLIAVGIVSFYGFMGLGVKDAVFKISRADIRLATVVSLLTSYLALVGTVSMFAQGDDLPEITKTMLTHFTTIIGVVIAFYFGSEAYLIAHGKVEGKDEANK
ncbi:MAG TPA: hypothetical protein VF268_03135 [Gammaproteobacteria bacterium]|jgi:hypothetical protein